MDSDSAGTSRVAEGLSSSPKDLEGLIRLQRAERGMWGWVGRVVNLVVASALGCAGGAVAELVVLWGNLTAWQKARHDARRARRLQVLPPLTMYIDPVPDVLVGVTRLVLGAVAGLAFHTQVTGAMAAITVGASAPMLLSQFGTATRVGDKSGRVSVPRGQKAAAE